MTKKDTEFTVPYKSICRSGLHAAQKGLYEAFTKLNTGMDARFIR